MKNTDSLKPATLGSISHGTLRTEDLLSAFISELEWQMSRNGGYFAALHSERDTLCNLIGEAQDCFAEDGEGIDPEKEEHAEYLLEEMQDALQSFAGPYTYFGTHCGDGADFGFWPCMDSIQELPTVEDSDEAKALGEDCKSVNDHRNVTVYGADGSVLLELV